MLTRSPAPAAAERLLPAEPETEAQAQTPRERLIGLYWEHLGEWERLRAALTVHLTEAEREALHLRRAELCGGIRLAAARLGWPDPTC